MAEFVTREEFEFLQQRLDTLERAQNRFDRIDAAIAALADVVARGFAQMERSFAQVDDRFAEVDERLARIEEHLERPGRNGGQR